MHGTNNSRSEYRQTTWCRTISTHVFDDIVANEKHNQQNQQHCTRNNKAHFSAAAFDEEGENGRTKKGPSQIDGRTM